LYLKNRSIPEFNSLYGVHHTSKLSFVKDFTPFVKVTKHLAFLIVIKTNPGEVARIFANQVTKATTRFLCTLNSHQMKKLLFIPLALLLYSTHGCAQPNANDRKVGDDCEDCDMMFEGMPTEPSWQTTIAGPGEPGERLIISGTIYKKDGKTPAPDVILYVYHTDSKGLYSPAPKQTAAKRHGHLRGWIKSDKNGHYEFSTIRPASYPNSNNPQHIHPLIKEPGLTVYWIDEFLFADDPLLPAQEKTRNKGRGGNGVVTLKKTEKGVWVGKRDIILGMNIPNY
jgi:protocatechuate 3,4-dioxygenase beta subunit